MSNGTKMIALSETNALPDPKKLVDDGAYWSWFVIWGDFIKNKHWNTKEFVTIVYNDPYVLTHSQIEV
jgi:mannan endo-1,4-beta-mannosidase